MRQEINVIYTGGQRFTLKTKNTNVLEALEEAWKSLQRIDKPNKLLDEHAARSSMVGDIYIYTTYGSHNLQYSRYFIIDPVGLTEVTEWYVKQWQKLKPIQTCFGTAHAERQGHIEKSHLIVTPEVFDGKDES